MEWLKSILGDSLYSQVAEKLGDKKILPSDGSYIPKSKYDEINEKNKLLSSKITEYESNSKNVEDLLKNNNELKTQFETLKNESVKAIELKDKELLNLTKTTILKEELSKSGAVYPELLLKLVDLDKVTLKDNKIFDGFNLDELKTSYKDMFPSARIEGNPPNQGNTPPPKIVEGDFSFLDNIKF